MIVERENEIRAFKSEEYWTLAANITKDGKMFAASLNKVDGKKAELKNQEQVDAIINRCQDDFTVAKIEKRFVKRSKMPFITSTYSRKQVQSLALAQKRPCRSLKAV